MNKSELILLYEAIRQSNLHPTTKSFLGEVLKNMDESTEVGMGGSTKVGGSGTTEIEPNIKISPGTGIENLDPKELHRQFMDLRNGVQVEEPGVEYSSYSNPEFNFDGMDRSDLRNQFMNLRNGVEEPASGVNYNKYVKKQGE